MGLTPLSTLLTCGRADRHPVAVRQSEILDFAQFRADVAGVAAAFSKPARVAITCGDSYRFAVALFGVLHAGGTAVLAANAQQSDASTYDALIDDEACERMAAHAPIPLSPLDAARACIDFYTSGSTGAPKKITKSLQLLENELATYHALWGEAHDQILSTVPHHHLYGLTFTLLWPLAGGCLFDTGLHHFWESLIAQLTPRTMIVSSPAHLERLGGIAPLALAQQPQRIFSAGAPLAFAASQQAREIMGCLPTEIFGSTETGAIATRKQQEETAVWQLLPGIRMQCDSAQRLVLESPFIGPQAFTTDDMVEPESDGFHFLGRFDRMVKIAGKRVHLSQVEECLLALPFVSQVAAATVSRGNRLELVAVVVLSDLGRAALADSSAFGFRQQLRRAMAATSEPAAIPRRWRFVEALPVHDLGKRRERDLLALFGEVV